MKKHKLDKIVRDFILNEGDNSLPTLKSRISTLQEMVSSIVGKNITEQRKLEIIREQVSNIKKEVRRLEERNLFLEEENQLLHEKLVLVETKEEE